MSTEFRLGQVVAGKFRIERVLGEGGMGVVVEATHLGLRRPVAIKFMRAGTSSESYQRFEREARAAAQIDSEHVVQVFDIDRLDTGEPFIVMELCRGQSLVEVISECHQIPVAEAIGYVLQACDAVSRAHQEGIIHRDLKPANLFVVRRDDGSSYVKVFDFGVSKLRPQVAAATVEASLTNTNTAFGTPAYMAPEQWDSAKGADERSDIWSLATIAYQLLAGRLPFDEPDFLALGCAILCRHPESIRSHRSDVPAPLDEAILKGLQKLPADRFQSVAAFAHEMAAFASEHLLGPVDTGLRSEQLPTKPASSSPTALTPAPVAPQPVVTEQPTRPSRRWPSFVLSGVVGAALSAGALFAVMAGTGHFDTPAPGASSTTTSTPIPSLTTPSLDQLTFAAKRFTAQGRTVAAREMGVLFVQAMEQQNMNAKGSRYFLWREADAIIGAMAAIDSLPYIGPGQKLDQAPMAIQAMHEHYESLTKQYALSTVVDIHPLRACTLLAESRYFELAALRLRKLRASAPITTGTKMTEAQQLAAEEYDAAAVRFLLFAGSLIQPYLLPGTKGPCRQPLFDAHKRILDVLSVDESEDSD